jgi:hypothetical protein
MPAERPCPERLRVLAERLRAEADVVRTQVRGLPDLTGAHVWAGARARSFGADLERVVADCLSAADALDREAGAAELHAAAAEGGIVVSHP